MPCTLPLFTTPADCDDAEDDGVEERCDGGGCCLSGGVGGSSGCVVVGDDDDDDDDGAAKAGGGSRGAGGRAGGGSRGAGPSERARFGVVERSLSRTSGLALVLGGGGCPDDRFMLGRFDPCTKR